MCGSSGDVVPTMRSKSSRVQIEAGTKPEKRRPENRLHQVRHNFRCFFAPRHFPAAIFLPLSPVSPRRCPDSTRPPHCARARAARKSPRPRVVRAFISGSPAGASSPFLQLDPNRRSSVRGAVVIGNLLVDGETAIFPLLKSQLDREPKIATVPQPDGGPAGSTGVRQGVARKNVTRTNITWSWGKCSSLTSGLTSTIRNWRNVVILRFFLMTLRRLMSQRNEIEIFFLVRP